MGRIAAGTIVNSDINQDADIPRSKLLKETKNIYLPLHEARVHDDPQDLLDNTTLSADDMAISKGATGFGTDQLILSGDDATDDDITQYARWPYVPLPKEYVNGEDITLRIIARVQTAGDTTNDLDCNAHAIGLDGTVGGDLVGTAAQSLTTSYVAYDFSISSSGLTVNTPLDIRIFYHLVDAATTGSVYGEIAAVILRVPIKG